MLNKQLFDDIENYHFSPELRDAVRVAAYLQMPLLLTGEPGTGKTEIAKALQQVLRKAEKEDVAIYTFNTKSISVFKDLIYRYDYLKHFQDVHLGKPIEVKDFEAKYITYNAFGRAIKEQKRSIVLIDEVDKAPRDFPNDLLDILEQTSFEVPELKQVDEKKVHVQSDKKPFIIITSNSEKSLPDAFLRRCIYFNIPFPKDEVLEKILLKHFDIEMVTRNIGVIQAWFEAVRKSLYRKKPSTAELIAWLQVMKKQDFPFEKLVYGDISKLDELEIEGLQVSFSVLAKTQDDFQKLYEVHQ